MSHPVLAEIRVAADRLSERISNFPLVNKALGRQLRERLRQDDWIKSPELYSFARPLGTPLLWKPDDRIQEHIRQQRAALPAAATTLDAFEQVLSLNISVVDGVEHWFKELGTASGRELDERLHALAAEMSALGTVVDTGKVQKLRRGQSQRPDYIIEMPGYILALESKALMGRAWPVGVAQTLMKALIEIEQMDQASEVMLVLGGVNEPTERHRRVVDGIDLRDLIGVIDGVATSGEPRSIGGMDVLPRSLLARELGLLASFYPIDTLDDWDRDLFLRSPTLLAAQQAAFDGWRQCAGIEIDTASPRLDMACIMPECWLGHPEISNKQMELAAWLQSAVWPTRPSRALAVSFRDLLVPVWFVSPDLSPIVWAARGV